MGSKGRKRSRQGPTIQVVRQKKKKKDKGGEKTVKLVVGRGGKKYKNLGRGTSWVKDVKKGRVGSIIN